MKKLLTVVAVVAALMVGLKANAETIERDSDGDLTINVFANIIESFRVTIDNDDMIAAGSPSADGILDLNAGMNGYDALKSVAAGVCRDENDVSPVFADAGNSCALTGGLTSASDTALDFNVDLRVKVELSGPGSIDLSAAMSGATNADRTFDGNTLEFASSTSSSVIGLVDQDTDTLHWNGQAPLNDGPGYDDTIVVTVTKN